MAFDIQTEEKRHQDSWNGFVIYTVVGSAADAAALALMSLFLL